MLTSPRGQREPGGGIHATLEGLHYIICCKCCNPFIDVESNKISFDLSTYPHDKRSFKADVTVLAVLACSINVQNSQSRHLFKFCTCIADGKPIGVTQILGHYDSDYEWNDGDKAMDQSLPSTNVAAAAAAAAGQRKYHSQFYKNGSECDLTGHFRASEVRFECDPSAGHDVIVSIEEPLSCEYVLTVATSRICDVEQLRPTPTEKPREIKCSPALTEAEYDKFLKYEKGEVTKRINHNCSVNFVRLEELFQYICGYKI